MTSSSFIFPGSARSNNLNNNQFGYTTDDYNYDSPNHHHNNSNDTTTHMNHNNHPYNMTPSSFTNSNSKNNNNNTRMENPLLFRPAPPTPSTSSSSNRNNDNSNYEEDMFHFQSTMGNNRTQYNMNDYSKSSSLSLFSNANTAITIPTSNRFVGTDIMNTAAGNTADSNLGQRKRVTTTSNITATTKQQQSIISATPDDDTMPPPPLASFSLGTADVPPFMTSSFGDNHSQKENNWMSGKENNTKNDSRNRHSNLHNPPTSTSGNDKATTTALMNSTSLWNTSMSKITTTSTAKTWILVVGATFDSDHCTYEDVLRELRMYGSITDHRYGTNWIAVQYSTELETAKALCHKSFKIYNHHVNNNNSSNSNTNNNSIASTMYYYMTQELSQDHPDMNMVLRSSTTMPSLFHRHDNNHNKNNNGDTNKEEIPNMWNSIIERNNDNTNRNNNSNYDNEITEDDILIGSSGSRRRLRRYREQFVTYEDSLCTKLFKWIFELQDDIYDYDLEDDVYEKKKNM